MAAPVSACREADETVDEVDGVSSETIEGSCVSKELLYPDKFAACYKESKLRIVGREGPGSGDKPLKTFTIPQSSVLSRIKDFLPKLSEANQVMSTELSKEPSAADRFNLECIDDDDKEPHIEMNLSMVPPEVLTIDESGDEESSSEDEVSNDAENDNLHNAQSAGALVHDMDHVMDEGLKIPGRSVHSNRKPRIEEVVSEQKGSEQVT
ncbi:uncharacterized protein C12orf45 homolog [Aplysia californica]|uniref:Uncharacterized protein C12orf45 homolog n=1 Tax=Aplysia californica TaxID=6500 RepID=A0ABM0JXX7_APLCA|nr:uncharacterized protein C12orf45 homolog [Aplysia californica]